MTKAFSADKFRVSSLDYLRGLAAFGIMIYHYFSWTFRLYNSDDVLGRIGLYCVSVFYVLSGLTLYLVYNNSFSNFTKGLKVFYTKRIFRIMPLLWVATLLSILVYKQDYSLGVLINNFSGLFSIYKIDSYIATGAWSIGNEIAFYLLFPVLIFISIKSRIGFIITSGLFFLISLAFTFMCMNTSATIQVQWKEYINPINQACLFIAGMMIGFFMRGEGAIWIYRLLALVSILLFVFYPVNGDRALLVTGFNRILFVIICISLVIWFYKESLIGKVLGDGVMHRFLSFLGECSYSVYLIHPVVFLSLQNLNIAFISNHVILKLLISVLMSLGISFVIYRYFEKPFIRLGAKVSARFTDQIN